ncbi:MAG: prepilin-type N-terminal cleavage/methylation domain-containing protein, partial [Tissierellia bacterium]|nr:prepilin-type N-terminal cleavage/methylation domain-containing protein [Tissierellia bacterium]
QDKSGFSLIEMVIVIGISSMLLLIILSLYNASTKGLKYTLERDETYLYGRYIVDYIKNEIKQSDVIIKSEKIENLDNKYPTNIGFVIMTDRGENYYNKGYVSRYNFCTYYMKDNILVRIAYNASNGKYPKAVNFGGYNEVYDRVISIDKTRVDYDNKLLELSISLGNSEEQACVFSSTIFLYNNIDY